MTHPFKTISFNPCYRTGVARLLLDRPLERNAINSAMRAEIRRAVSIASKEARVLIIEGAGAIFCSGHDFKADPEVTAETVKSTLIEEYLPMIQAIDACQIPVIAAVNGPAIGVGVALAMACDVVIAQERSFFSLPFLQMGMIPDAGCMDFLSRRMGSRRAMGAALFGERIPAKTAVEWGLVWEAVPRSVFRSTVDDRCDHLSGLSPVAVSGLQTLTRRLEGRSLAENIVVEANLQVKCLGV